MDGSYDSLAGTTTGREDLLKGLAKFLDSLIPDQIDTVRSISTTCSVSNGGSTETRNTEEQAMQRGDGRAPSRIRKVLAACMQSRNAMVTITAAVVGPTDGRATASASQGAVRPHKDGAW